MASKEKKAMLLALALLLVHPPPFVQTPQLLCSTAGVTNIESALVEAASVAALAAMGIHLLKEWQPHPQQGGCRITIQYLQLLPDPEARWAFR